MLEKIKERLEIALEAIKVTEDVNAQVLFLKSEVTGTIGFIEGYLEGKEKDE